ncbi:GntR family transcriptional regulator [Paenibacillus contaminans]|uniref:GntR family transcriptional regulator n=1 Tax=Paenibacillus contaminans TaxID=450362 RepID=A0A329LTS5_9BACL|nr:GntR family transcriptional regulator [Paenibacillus contaminans]RAV10798.1 GntR family transcriptional regulator [Paenibacillus contaminans]
MDFNSKEPIYSQIIDDIRTKFINGTYELGQEIPSRRELAKTLGVNPNTIQRAYKEMEDMNLIVTVRGQGSLMTRDAGMLQALRQEATDRAVRECVEVLRAMGNSDTDILDSLKAYLEGSKPL